MILTNQRISRAYNLALMMNVLNESMDTVERPENSIHPMVMEAMRLVWDVERKKRELEIGQSDLSEAEKTKALKKLKTEEKRRTEPTARYQNTALAKLTDAIGLHLPERSLLNVVLHLVAVVVAISNKDLITITNFGDKHKNSDRRKKADKAKIEAAFKAFCPGQDLNESKASVLVSTIVKTLAGEQISDERKHMAIEAMFIIFDHRLANDKKLWAIVDTFSLNSTEQSDNKYFTDGTQNAPRRRYHALNCALILLLGKQYGELTAATSGLNCGEDFQLAFLRSSISKLARHIMKKEVKQSLFTVNIFQRGKFDESPCFGAMKAILDQSEERKGDFHASKMILNNLNGDEDSINGTIMLVARASGLKD